MAKRGETRPWRMTYTWPPCEGLPKGITSTETFPTRTRAEDAAAAQVARPGGLTGLRDCSAVVTHREVPGRVFSRYAGEDITWPAAGGGMVEAIAHDLHLARQDQRLLADTSVAPFNGGAIVTVAEHPTDPDATNHRAHDVVRALAAAGWATRPSGTQVVVAGRR